MYISVMASADNLAPRSVVSDAGVVDTNARRFQILQGLARGYRVWWTVADATSTGWLASPGQFGVYWFEDSCVPICRVESVA